MSGQTTRQAQQRAKVSQRRRSRHPRVSLEEVNEHGVRSQSGVKIRSKAAWKAYLGYRKIVAAEARKNDRLKAEWRARAAQKRSAS